MNNKKLLNSKETVLKIKDYNNLLIFKKYTFNLCLYLLIFLKKDYQIKKKELFQLYSFF